MRQHEPLARATLDTLPMNIAVLDGDGTILFTNRSWQDFGDDEAASDVEADLTGTNYFAGIDMTSDSYAAQAVEGIQSVMDGEETLFTMEYPCEMPDGSKWFLMRVVPLAEDGEEVVVAHIDITERKQAEIRAEERADQLRAERQRLEHLLQRINGLVQDVLGSLMEAETRAEVLQSLCDRFVTAEPFVATWVGDLDLRSSEISPVAWSGEDAVETTIDLEDEDDPTAAAARTRDLQVVQDVSTLPESSVHHEICPDAAAVAALPLVADETLYGVLTAYAGQPDAFDERETVILSALGQTAGTAINAIERKRILTADELVEVELAIGHHEGFVYDLAAACDCSLEYAGSVSENPETFLMFFTVEGATPEAVLEQAGDHPDIVSVTHVSDFDGRAFFEFEVEEPPIVSTLADFGAETRSIVVADGVARVRAELAADAKVRSIVDTLDERFDDVELLAYREREHPTQTKQEFVSNLIDELTDRQRTALQKAYVGGFFEWPRGTSGEDLAESMDISPSTYHQHLRAAQRKVFRNVFER